MRILLKDNVSPAERDAMVAPARLLFLASVAVPVELRGQGWARRLIEATETAAVQRGCQYIWLDTYSFQARPFYEKLDYRVFGQLDDHPPGHTRFFMFKTLRTDAA